MSRINCRSCYACGQPIPRLLMEDGKYNFQCTKCEAETRPQDSLEEALSKWNEGEIYLSKKFWSMLFNKE